MAMCAIWTVLADLLYLSFGEARDYHIPLLGNYLTSSLLGHQIYCIQYCQEKGEG
jgi:hypothetical protein